MAGTLIAIASGPAILCLYLAYKARMPEAFPHWVFISNGIEPLLQEIMERPFLFGLIRDME